MSDVEAFSRLLLCEAGLTAKGECMTPTEKAKWFLDGSVENFRNAKAKESVYLIALGLEQMAQGMQELATGLRALYLKMDAVEATIKKSQSPFQMNQSF